MDCWTGRQEGRPCHAKLIVGMSMLERSLEKAVELGSEWLYETKFSGPQAEAAMERVASQQKLLMEQKFLREGHAFAAMRAAAHFSVESALSERCNGVSSTTISVSCWKRPTGPLWAKRWKSCGRAC